MNKTAIISFVQIACMPGVHHDNDCNGIRTQCESAELFGIDDCGDLYRYNFADETWTKMSMRIEGDFRNDGKD